MATSANGRAQAIYNSIVTANPKMAQASDAEKQHIQQNLQAIFGGDLAYLVGNVTVVPGSMQAPSGATVQVAYPAGNGSTTTAVAVTGTGSIT